jgi:hypothetical protein
MKRRRHLLQVSTFPFLAVLLCAMGSLILLLLVIDRRAKIVEQRKAELAEQAVDRAEADEARKAAERQAQQQAELERQRAALHARLAAQQQELSVRVTAARGEAAAKAEAVRKEQQKVQELDRQAKEASARLSQRQAEIESRRAELAQTTKLDDTSRAELGRLTDELRRLEQTIGDLKLARQQQQQTYSLVPYHGRQGDSRRPIYVECTADGLVFHPDGTRVAGGQIAPDELRRQVQSHVAARAAQPGAGDARGPYLLLLVRPDGIATYYRTLAAMADLRMDFGYEFIERDWVLKFDGAGDAITKDTRLADAANQPTPPAATPHPPQVVPAIVLPAVRHGDGAVVQATPGAGDAASPNGPAHSGPVPATGQAVTTGTTSQSTAAAAAAAGALQAVGPGQTGGTAGTGAVAMGQPVAGGPGGDTDLPPPVPAMAQSWSRLRREQLAALDRGHAKVPDDGSIPSTGAPHGNAGAGAASAAATGSGPTGSAGSGSVVGTPTCGPGVPAGGSGSGAGTVTGGAGGVVADAGPALVAGPEVLPSGHGSGATGSQSGASGIASGGSTGPADGIGAAVRITAPAGTVDGRQPAAAGVSAAAGLGTGVAANTAGGTPQIGFTDHATARPPATGAALEIWPSAARRAPATAPEGQAGGPTVQVAGAGGIGQGVGTGPASGTTAGEQGTADNPQSNGTSQGTGKRLGGAAGPLAGGGPGTAGSGTTGGGGTASGTASGNRGQDTAGPTGEHADGATAGAAGADGSSGAGAAADGSAGGAGSGLPGLGGYGGGPASGRPVVVRPGVLGANRDWYLVVECRASGLVFQPQRAPEGRGPDAGDGFGLKTLVVHPQRTQFTVESLDDDATRAQLLQTVRATIDHRQATVYPGEPPYRPIIRFVVHADGLRAYYNAYPVLEQLHVPMTRVNLQPGE